MSYYRYKIECMNTVVPGTPFSDKPNEWYTWSEGFTSLEKAIRQMLHLFGRYPFTIRWRIVDKENGQVLPGELII